MNRRTFIQASAALGCVAGLENSKARPLPSGNGLSIGMYVTITDNPEPILKQVHDLGFRACEVYTDNHDPVFGRRLRQSLDQYQLHATSIFSMGPGGKMVWDFYQGPETIGLVPREWRRQRIDHLKSASNFAKLVGVSAVETHCGFIPENPNDVLYKETVEALREVVGYCRANGQTFLYHAGQETPVTLLRTMQDVGFDNQGVGLDTANLIMYDRGHPVDSLDVYGSHLKAVNPKDAVFPTDPKNLGKEVPIGLGKVDFPRLVRRLQEIGYRGVMNIEREISGPQQIEDIKAAKVYLEQLIS
jgi:L-ribulose-5-phosphate 3-epimerase